MLRSLGSGCSQPPGQIEVNLHSADNRTEISYFLIPGLALPLVAFRTCHAGRISHIYTLPFSDT